MKYTILIDFGSTFTKSTVVDMEEQRVCYTFRTPSTVGTDASLGLVTCLDQIRQVIGEKALLEARKLASSSAAGGLRMVVVGLTESLSLMAGKNAAYGAGAKIIASFSGIVTDAALEQIRSLDPEIILLCGGYEKGNSKWILENAKRLAHAGGIKAPIVYAGNSQAAEAVHFLLYQNGKTCILADNIIPAVNTLNIASTVEAVRDIFMKRITHMKGLDTVKQYIGPIVMPTPAAVLKGVRLLAEGTPTQPGWEQIMLVDMGGATTDVHSYAATETLDGVRLVGAPEPRAKRTVEGDIGARESVNSLLEAADMRRIRKYSGLADEEIRLCQDKRLEDHAFVPDTEKEKLFEQAIAMEAVRVSVRRHAGQLYDGYTEGVQRIQKGKDLMNIKAIIGTGGPIINSIDPRSILAQALRTKAEKDVLLPEKAAFYLDTSYIFYAAGLLSGIDRETAMRILLDKLIPLT
ncbi:glutamate mutase L [uncultured Megasphaera sp.]|jgi:uncharacterized protein (TIGR01319 family)|uniref:glutamate mutase L n=1 Tax=uncultured Megasphaera sp. TaxID=165188 RepID=UPI00258DF4FB|nr:glutamate mutase L [uncultured Megasphaera sp.]